MASTTSRTQPAWRLQEYAIVKYLALGELGIAASDRRLVMLRGVSRPSEIHLVVLVREITTGSSPITERSSLWTVSLPPNTTFHRIRCEWCTGFQTSIASRTMPTKRKPLRGSVLMRRGFSPELPITLRATFRRVVSAASDTLRPFQMAFKIVFADHTLPVPDQVIE